MKTLTILFLALIASSNSEEAKRPRRGYSGNYLEDHSIDLNHYEHSHIPLQETELHSHGIDKFLAIPEYNPVEIDLKVNLPPHKSHFSIPIAVSNSVEKPVQEDQEYVPPQSISSVVIPQMIPPATPVNAAASNVPAGAGAVFLGSGSLGIVNLGNGAYALGSGSIGYSGNRAQPRPSAMVPVYPPLPATPNLIPAAVPSEQPPPGGYPSFPDFGHPFLPSPVDGNGYEMLQPNNVRFGMPVVRPPRLRTTQSFATPTRGQLPPQLPGEPPQQFMNSQPQPQFPQFSQPPPQPQLQVQHQPQVSGARFGDRIPSDLYSYSSGFK